MTGRPGEEPGPPGQGHAVPPASPAGTAHPGRGLGRVLVLAYGVLGLAATGRAVLQVSSYFANAPLAYTLSAVAAVIYVVAAVALARGGPAWTRVATWAVAVEMVGVLVTGVMTYVTPSLFPDRTVWSHFGQGYGFVPLVLPAIGLWWLLRGRSRVSEPPTRASRGRPGG